MSKYLVAWNAAIDAAREAGELLRSEFHRPGGPRGSGGHAEVDEQAEHVIRQKLLSAFPAAYLGEETGSASGSEQEHVWLVDPNDGTAAYLKGSRKPLQFCSTNRLNAFAKRRNPMTEANP